MATGLVERFSTWAQGRDGLEPDVVSTLVEFKRDYLGDPRPGRWRAGDLSELMLQVIPAKMTADDEWYAAAVPTVRAFLDFAHAEGLFQAGSAPVSTLIAELDEVAGQFDDAVHDTSRFGLAKTLMSAMGPIDVSDPDALAAAVARFNALPTEQRTAITDPALERMTHGGLPAHLWGDDETDDEDGIEGPTMPVVRLAPEVELATAARSCPMWRQLETLAEWVGERRALTSTGVLKLSDAREACERLDLPALPEWAADQAGAGGREHRPRSARELTGLHRLWLLAERTGWVGIEGTRASRGPAWHEAAEADEEGLLELWGELFGAALDMGLGLDDAPGPGRAAVADDLPGQAVLHALMAAYVGDAHTFDDLLVETLDGEAAQLEPEMAELVRRIEERRTRQFVERLAALGAVQVHEDETVDLTPLGVWGMREQFLAVGIPAPALGTVLDLDAQDLLLQTGLLPPRDAAAARAEWIEARGRRESAEALVEAARTGTALVRLAAMGVLEDDLEEQAPAALQPWLADRVLGPHVRMFLAQRGLLDLDDPRALQDDQRWFGVESLAAFLEHAEAPVRTDDLPEDAWELAEKGLGLQTAWQLDHPQLLRVLDAIGTGHPRGQVRKAAKKAAHKARMAGAPEPCTPEPGTEE